MRASAPAALAALLLCLAAAGPLEDVAGAVRALPSVLHRVEDVDRRLALSLPQAEHRVEDVPLTLDAVSEEGAGQPASDASAEQPLQAAAVDAPGALHETREQLQRTLDQLLKEAEQWAKKEGDDHTDQDEYYEDEDGGVGREEAIKRARAELKHKVEQMLMDTEQQALEEAMSEEGGDANGISETPPQDDARPTQAEDPGATAADVPDDRDENDIAEVLTNTTASTLFTTSPVAASTPHVTSSASTGTTNAPPMTMSTSPVTTSTSTVTTSAPPETTSTAPLTTSAPPPATSTAAPVTTSTTVEWTTEENVYRHLVVPLDEARRRDGTELEVDVEPGTAVVEGQDESVRQVDVPEDVVEAAVAGAAAVRADRLLASGASSCPTKLPTPLRLPALPSGALESADPQCARDSRLLDLHIRNHTLWAVQMQDAGAGSITGLLEGNVYHLGDFDECMDVRGPVAAQYCVVEVYIQTPPRTPDYRHRPGVPADPLQSVWNRIKHEGEQWTLPLDRLHVALCAPSSCAARDIQDSVERALHDYAACSRLPVNYSVTVSETLCTSAAKQRPPFTEGEIVYIVIVVVLVLMVLSGTLIDFFATKKKGFRWILVVFSLRRSWHMLTKADPRPMGLSLDALAGARTVNMLLLVLAHRGFNMLRGPVHNFNQSESMPRALLQTRAAYAQLFVDTCFVLGGLLVSLLELTRAHAHGKDSDSRAPLMAAMVHRYVRLTPSYAMVVFFYATLFWRLGSGPLWDQVVGYESQACAKYWWTNIFYVNNYISTDKLCMSQSWYLPVDLHLFFIGSALTLLLSRHRRTGLGFLLVFLGLSVLIPFLVSYFGSKPALSEMLPSFIRAPDQANEGRSMYAPTHVRAAPYMVGLFAGYLFQRLALRHKERFTQGVTLLLCLGGVALTAAALLSSVVFYDSNLRHNDLVSALYAALCPVVWSAGVCLVFASLVLGSQTILSTFLSWKPLVVVSRLTYNVYLTHWAFQVASVAKARTPYHLDLYNLFYLSFGDIVASFLTSLVLFLLVEAPFRLLARKITEAPPESKVHLQTAEEREKSSALEAGFTKKVWKNKS